MSDGASADNEGVAQAVGRVTEALETIERARGHLYSFHQLTGRADLQLDEALSRADRNRPGRSWRNTSAAS